MMVRPRRDRWLSIPEVLERIARGNPTFFERIRDKTRRYQLLAVRRLIRQVEKRDNAVISKRFNGNWYVSFESAVLLMTPGEVNLDSLDRNLGDLVHEHRELVKRVNDNCSRLRDHARSIAKLSEKQTETTRYLARLLAIDSE